MTLLRKEYVVRKRPTLKSPLLVGCFWLTVATLPGLSQAQQAGATPPASHSIIRYESIHHPVIGRRGMVVSQREIASRIGADILRRGGNAIDAAVGVGFALAVALPRAGNIGGGGFMLIHLADTSRTIAIDFRETAPAAAYERVFLDDDGNVDEDERRFGHRSVGVPGTVAGLAHALKKYGTLSLRDVLDPAIELASSGIVYDYDIASAIATRDQVLRRHPHTESTFFRADGAPHEAGDVFVQPELAKTLQRIASFGPREFYSGDTAQLIVDEMRRGGGLMTLDDLAAYAPVEREPVRGSYAGYEIVSMPPPSSGGVHILQILNVLEHFPLKDMGANSARALHITAEAMKLAYADRSKHLGDPGFYPVPVDWLTSKEYGRELAAQIVPAKARPSDEIAPGIEPIYESEDTTHFSVTDSEGNAVSTTYTLNFSFGSGITVPGAGFLLNNEMADFSAKPGVPDAFGLLGGEANAVAPGKRPLSAMTPTIVLKDGRPALVTGSPGGSRIITAVLQHIVNTMVHGMNVAEANHTARIHHQWYPDTLFYEAGISPDTIELLRSWGHQVELSGTMGSVQALSWDGKRYRGAADPRRPEAGAIAVND